MVIARVTTSTKRRRRGTHKMYRVAPEDSLKVAEFSFRLHRRFLGRGDYGPAAVPFPLSGGLVALYVRDINLSVSVAVGFISLFGVAVMSGCSTSPR